MPNLSKQIKFEDDEAYPYGTAVIPRRLLDNWSRMAEVQERSRDCWKTTAHIFAAIIVGLLIALLYVKLFPTPVIQAPSELTADPEPISVAPSTIRAGAAPAVWI